MFWSDELTGALAGPQIINDSKTPSGSAHVGALRGPLIHDALFRALRDRGHPVRYLFGCDDYDPVDEIPYGQAEAFEQYRGAPLCNVPPPPGSTATDMADHYIGEFWGVFKTLGIAPEFYRMRDLYRDGRFNEAIDRILRQAGTVREIYLRESGAARADNWHPFQTICERCGRIGTTEVVAYDGREVEYHCRPALVKWAQGCGHHGKVSPFDGRGKLPWKLEWCAKWHVFPVTIEGAGQDHSTKGGSRDVSAACLRALFGGEPPLNCPYGFFLVGGSKMSSSKGVGVAAREMVDFLPPEVLRFLMIRPAPKQHVNFDSSETHIVKVFNEFDRARQRYFQTPPAGVADRRIYELSQVTPEPEYWQPDFPLVIALIQLPHLDTLAEIEKRKGAPLSDLERRHLDARLHAARHWLEHYAAESDKIRLQDTLPARAHELSIVQRGFLHILAGLLADRPWEDNALQVAVFDAARLTPIDQPAAFKAIYRVFLDKESGPKAGNLLSFMDRAAVIRRLAEVPHDPRAFWVETALTPAAVSEWAQKHLDQIASVNAAWHPAGPHGMLEIQFLFNDQKCHARRILPDAPGMTEDGVRAWLDTLGPSLGRPVTLL